MTFPLSTERLTLRLHRPDDADALRAIYEIPDVARFLLEEPWTAEDAVTQLEKRITRTGLDSPARALGVVVEHAGVVIGDVALWLPDDDGRKAEIGWVFAPSAGGRGFATEAVHAVIEHGFTVHELHRIEAQTDARNTASNRMCERLGMHREAHLRQNWWSKDEWTDTMIYGLLASDRG